MSSLLKCLVLLLFVAGLSNHTFAQVKFNLSLLGDQKTYLVSMISESNWNTPANTVASIQVVLKYSSERSFLAGNIVSLVNGVSWNDNAYVESPGSAQDYNFVCFTLNEKGTKQIPFPRGQEVPLFTFVNLSQECVGKIELIDNNTDFVKRVVNRDRLNITQNITVLGARGNAYTGILNGTVDCAEAVITSTDQVQPLVNHLRVYPVPAHAMLNVAWENAVQRGPDKLLISNPLGENVEMHRELLPNASGEQSLQVNVASYPSGLYTGTLINARGERQHFRFIVTHQ